MKVSVLKNMPVLRSFVAFTLLSAANTFLTIPKSCLISGPSVWIYSRIVHFLLLNTLRTGDADLRFYIETVQDR